MPRIYELEFDEENEEELWRHGLDVVRVAAVLADRPAFFRNKRRRTGLYKMVGPDASGVMLTVIIRPTAVRGRWRAVTGWQSTKGEVTLWRRAT